MSILIKGMEMPKVGGKIITIYADGQVLYDGGYIKAVPVPSHGRLIDADFVMNNTTPIWRCRCDCGNDSWVLGRNLKYGRTKSCGCLRAERASERLRQYDEREGKS